MVASWKTWAVAALVLAALLFGGLWLHQRDARIRAEGSIEPLREQLDSARAAHARERAMSDSVVAASNARAARTDSVLERERVVRAAVERRLATTIAAQPAAADSIVVISETGDTLLVREAVVRLQELHEEERASWLAVTRSDALVIAELRTLDAARVAALQGLERRALAAEERARVAEALADAALEARPGWIERHSWQLSLLAGAGAGWAARGWLDSL